MRKKDALLRGDLGEAESNRLITLLSSMGIDAAVAPDNWGRLAVYVASEDVPAALRLLEEEESERAAEREHLRREEMRSRFSVDVDVPEGWFGRGSSAVFGLIAICVGVFVLSIRGPDAGTRSGLLSYGAISYAEIRAGEVWRFLTAVFLHFDISHLLSNMAAMIVIAPPLAHQIGALRFLAVFLVGGIGANVVSYLLAPAVGLKAGASGGIAAVLGALGGLGLHPRSQTRYKPWQILGALAAFYGLTIGFGPGRDNVAHVAGLLIGIALGRVMERPHRRQGVVRVAPDPSRSD